MISVKDSTVEVSHLSNGMLFGLIVADQVYTAYGYDTIITSGHEQSAHHARTSLHYSGNAVDLRTRHVKETQRQEIADEISRRLGIDYDSILESDHIHLECQPRHRL